jgi:CheY-like chemotaxis protein
MNRLVIAAINDLFFASKVRATAESLGIQVRFMRNAEALMKAVKEGRPDLIIVNLESETIDSIELAKQLHADPEMSSIPLLGFGSHVMTDLLTKAKEAGYAQVLPRSVFSSRLAEILAEGRW